MVAYRAPLSTGAVKLSALPELSLRTWSLAYPGNAMIIEGEDTSSSVAMINQSNAAPPGCGNMCTRIGDGEELGETYLS